MKIQFLKYFAATALCASFAAQAATMDFNGLVGSPNGLILAGNSISEDGFTLTSTVGGAQPWEYYYRDFLIAQDGWQNNRGTSNGTTSIIIATNSSARSVTFDLVKADSDPFAFASIDIGGANAHNGQFYNTMATVWNFTGYNSAGTILLHSVNANPNVFATYAMPAAFSSIRKLSVTASIPIPGIKTSNDAGMTANFDNIVVAAAVPEPEAYAMMLAGLLLIYGVAGRKKAAA